MPQFQRLQDALEGRRLALHGNTLGIQPEQVLVLETIGSIQNFINAVRRTDGLEWLAEHDIRDIEPEHGFSLEDKPGKSLNGQMFMVMTDQKALSDLRSMFEKWKRDPTKKFSSGLRPFRQVFEYLKKIRPWGVRDRIRETGVVEDWRNRLRDEQEAIPFEVELWHREPGDQRVTAGGRLRFEIGAMGGSVLQQSVIPEIAYHGVLARLPASKIQRIIDRLDADDSLDEYPPDIRLLAADNIMYVRPVGQCAIRIADSEEPAQTVEFATTRVPQGDPVAALLDGMPLTGHQAFTDLAGDPHPEKLDGVESRVIVDDPDGYADTYQAADRSHGTAMASLICHGDLHRPAAPLSTPLYFRPIMKPVKGFDGTVERIPEDVLPVDLIHRAVRRMYEPEGDEPAIAPTVQVINLSIGDPIRPFFREMSAWARLLDWLSWKYQVLFVVSAGNAGQDIELDVPTESLSELRPTEVAREVVSAVTKDTRNRRILSPAETLNGLSIGAAHDDWSGMIPNRRVDPFPSFSDGPNVVSRHGPGYRRALKPEVLVPGGRQTVAHKIPTPSNRALTVRQSRSRPGQAVAAPGRHGLLNEKAYTTGTSNAAALTTRTAVELHEMLNGLRSVTGGPPAEYEAVLIKTLLVHGASWRDIADVYRAVMKGRHGARAAREQVGRCLGYGAVDFERVKSCTEQRVTVLGFGELDDKEAHRFDLPIPPGLSGRAQRRRLTVTLAWLTPIASTRQQYRIARLWFSPKNELAGDRVFFADHNAVRRGTVQHEILEGKKATSFVDGKVVKIAVNCRADAVDLPRSVRYGLAVTLEVSEGVDIPIYQEVRDRLRVPVRPPNR